MNHVKKIITAWILLAVTVLGAGCSSAQPKADPTESRAPEWTKTAVLYEVNLRQYTKSGTKEEVLFSGAGAEYGTGVELPGQLHTFAL